MKFEVYEIENDKENSGKMVEKIYEIIRIIILVDDKVDDINLKFEVYVYNKYKDEKDNKRSDKIGNDVSLKFEVHECTVGGM